MSVGLGRTPPPTFAAPVHAPTPSLSAPINVPTSTLTTTISASLFAAQERNRQLEAELGETRTIATELERELHELRAQHDATMAMVEANQAASSRSASRHTLEQERLAVQKMSNFTALAAAWRGSWDERVRAADLATPAAGASRAQRVSSTLQRVANLDFSTNRLRTQLLSGIGVQAWEAGSAAQLDCTLKFVPPESTDVHLAAQFSMLQFQHGTRRALGSVMATLRQRKEADPLPPVYMHEVTEVHAGPMGFPELDLQDPMYYVTLMTVPTATAPARAIVLRTTTRSDRNTLLLVLRYLLSEATVRQEDTPSLANETQETTHFSLLVRLEEVRLLLASHQVREARMLQLQVAQVDDLNALELEVTRLRRRLLASESALETSARSLHQEISIRNQLSERLENLLLEKEELRIQLDAITIPV